MGTGLLRDSRDHARTDTPGRRAAEARAGLNVGQLRVRHDLNILGMEVLAAGVSLEADVYPSAPSPRLEESLRREGRSVHIVA
jgi:hypothetical protein